ncbi:unnamed protein product [Porites evermanni]|uniref:Uncharacterized protein n=1 Tax=Porites evermanni TaxID=104178 RepID=A0ABN8LWD5_9CNID|nr:unnamed protein product [Porites evermanni]
MNAKNALEMSFVIARHRRPNAYVTLASQHTLSGYVELYNERASTLACIC